MASRTTFDPEREVTDRIIAAIEAGTPPWRKPWTGASGGVAFPLRVTGERYRGINVLVLWLAAAEKGYSSAHWMMRWTAPAQAGTLGVEEPCRRILRWKSQP